jgi:hypothetical protein
MVCGHTDVCFQVLRSCQKAEEFFTATSKKSKKEEKTPALYRNFFAFCDFAVKFLPLPLLRALSGGIFPENGLPSVVLWVKFSPAAGGETTPLSGS